MISKVEKKEKEKIKVECRTCIVNCQYHGMFVGCLRAWVEGGPQNCIDFKEIRKDRQ